MSGRRWVSLMETAATLGVPIPYNLAVRRVLWNTGGMITAPDDVPDDARTSLMTS
ncbi:hypothetical protein FOA52_010621 [Chlamydomonas sp. UWO 241]|nr:hypothetical protein FOA52_010621 [Chlamydomonas sp. UWO 241]